MEGNNIYLGTFVGILPKICCKVTQFPPHTYYA